MMPRTAHAARRAHRFMVDSVTVERNSQLIPAFIDVTTSTVKVYASSEIAPLVMWNIYIPPQDAQGASYDIVPTDRLASNKGRLYSVHQAVQDRTFEAYITLRCFEVTTKLGVLEYLRPNCIINNPKRNQFNIPARKELIEKHVVSPEGIQLSTSFFVAPGSTWLVNDALTVSQLQGHPTVDTTAQYGILFVDPEAGEQPLIRIDVRGAIR